MLNYFYNLSSRGSEGLASSKVILYLLRIVVAALDWII